MSQLRNYKKELAERVDKINLSILKSKDISDKIDIMKRGLTKYEQIEIQINKMMGPEAKTPLEQGPNDTQSEYEWKEQILQKIKTHWKTLFTENNNCKLKKTEYAEPMA